MALATTEIEAVLLRVGFVLQKRVNKVLEFIEPNAQEVVYVNRTSGQANSALVIDPLHAPRRDTLLERFGVLSEDARYHNDDMTRFPTAKRKGKGESHYGVPFGFGSERALLSFLAEVFPAMRAHEPTSASGDLTINEDSPISHEVRANARIDDGGVEKLLKSLNSAEDMRRRILSERVVREGQDDFKKNLLGIYEGRCAITGCDVPAALEAAHIIPYQGAHTNIEQNGILLRCDIHALFDSLLLWIDPESRSVVLHDSIRESEYASLHGAILRDPSASTACADNRLLRHRLEAMSCRKHDS
jgi:hypothetical protein